MSATEVAVRRALFQPLIVGMLRKAPGLHLIVELFISELFVAENPGRMIESLFNWLGRETGLDLRNFRRECSADVLWAEIKSLEQLHRQVLAEAHVASADEADLAISVASEVLHGG